jgi:multidrug efflux system outer membrane protein
MKRTRIRLALTAALLLAGCASAPGPRATPVAIPEDYSVAPPASAIDSDGVEGDWVDAFDDSVAVRLVAEALRHNPSVGIAAANLAAARAQARISGAASRPQVQAGAAGARSKRNFIGFPIGGGGPASTTSTTWSAEVSASWEPDLFGRLRAGRSAALADVQAAEADTRGVRLSVAAQTLRAWFALLEAQRQVELAEATVLSQRVSAEQIESRYERGLRPTLDVLLARSQLSATEAGLHQRRRQLDAATRQLEILAGRYPAGDLRTGGDLPDLPGPVPVGLPAELVSRRPDLAAAERRLAAADARVREARRALYPRISLTASGGRSSDELTDLLDGDFGVWNLVGNLTQPIWAGGRLRAGVDLAEAGADRLVLAYAQAALRAFAEVESGLAAEAHLAAQEAALTAASRESTEARLLAEQRYRKGLTDLLTLLTAQRSAYDAESRLLAVRRQRLETRIDLHLALGGGFDTPGNAVAEGHAP